MRGAYRNRRKMWYANFLGREEILDAYGRHTGHYRTLYTKPKVLWANKSTTSGLTNNNISGKVRRYVYGEEKDYNVTVNPIPANCDIAEQSVLWVDVQPEIEEDGSTNTPYDHVITRISYALNWRALQALKVDRARESEDEDVYTGG